MSQKKKSAATEKAAVAETVLSKLDRDCVFFFNIVSVIYIFVYLL